jgi:flotillin
MFGLIRSATERIIVISSGGDGAGSSKVTQDISNIIAQVPATVEAITGIDLTQTIRNIPGFNTNAASEAAENEPNKL